MPFQPAERVIRVEPIYTYDGQVVQNVLYYQTDPTPDAIELTAFAAQWVTQWQAGIRASQPTNVSLNTLKVTSLDSESAPGIEYTTGLPLAGTATGTGLPNNVTVAVRYLTALRGRSYRGRSFHIGIRATDVTLNQITTTFQTNLRAAYILMLNVATTQSYFQGVLSRYAAGVLRAEGQFTDITAVQVERVIDSQRRRLPGRGN